MEQSPLQPRLGLSVPYEWWPSAPSLKEIEAAGFAWVQVPAPPSVGAARPASVGAARRRPRRGARDDGAGARPARAGLAAGGDARGRPRARGPALLRGRDRRGATSSTTPPTSPTAPPARTRCWPRLARSLAAALAERLGVVIAIENLAPVFPGPDVLSFTPGVLRTMANRIGSPAARPLPRRRPRQRRRRPAPRRPDGADRAGARPHRPLPPARQPRRAARRRDAAGARPPEARPAPAARPRHGSVGAAGAAASAPTAHRCCWRSTRRAHRRPRCTRARWRRWAKPPKGSPPS